MAIIQTACFVLLDAFRKKDLDECFLFAMKYFTDEKNSNDVW